MNALAIGYLLLHIPNICGYICTGYDLLCVLHKYVLSGDKLLSLEIMYYYFELLSFPNMYALVKKCLASQ